MNPDRKKERDAISGLIVFCAWVSGWVPARLLPKGVVPLHEVFFCFIPLVILVALNWALHKFGE